MLANRSNNQAHEVTIEYSCSQSTIWYDPLSWFGSCYGYSSVQAEGDEYLQIPTDTAKRKLPLTNYVLSRQQIIPTYSERHDKLHISYFGLNDLIDEFDNQSEKNPKIIIICHALIGGHAVGLHKRPVDRKFEFFDCNRAKHIINNKEQLKRWLPGYFDINYAGCFFGFSADTVKKQPVPFIPNFLASCKLLVKKIVSIVSIGVVLIHMAIKGNTAVKNNENDKLIDEKNNAHNKLPEYGTTSRVNLNLSKNQSTVSRMHQDVTNETNSNSKGFIPSQINNSSDKIVPAQNTQESYLYTAARMGAIGRR